MAQARSSQHVVSYVAETTFGTTPTTPTMLELRHNGGFALNLTKSTLTSEQLNARRQVDYVRHGLQQVGGDIPVELAYGAFDAFLESLMYSTWSTNVLKVGTTEKSFTIEDGATDIGVYRVFTGCIVNSLAVTVTPDAIVQAVFNIVGQDSATDTSPLDASVTAAPTHKAFVGFQGSISEGGSTIGTVADINFTIENALSPSFVVGSDIAPSINAGRCQVTGTMTAHFTSRTLLDKFINETDSSISITFEGLTGGDLTFNFPSVTYTGGELNIPNNDEGITVSLPFQAVYDSSNASTVVITRTPA